MTTPIIGRQTIDFLSYSSTVISAGSMSNSSTISIYDKNDPNGLFNITYTNTLSNLSISSNNNNTNVNMNLGINNTSPSYTLDIGGNLNLTNNIIINNTTVLVGNSNISNVNISVNDTICSTSVNSCNIGVFRNRIINGNMNIDSLNSATNPIIAGDTSISNASNVLITPTIDKWQIVTPNMSPSIVATQVPLSQTDINNVGNQFQDAVCLSTVPTNGMIVNIPFNNSLNDVLGFATSNNGIDTSIYSSNSINQNYCIDFTRNGTLLTPYSGSNMIFYAFPTSYKASPPMSISCWIKTNSSSTNQYIYSFQSSGNISCGELYLNSSYRITVNLIEIAPQGSIVSTNTHGFTSTSTLNIGQWYHLTLTIPYNGNINLYINGVYNSSSSNITQSTGVFLNVNNNTNIVNGFNIGSLLLTGSSWFRGFLADFRMYNRILTSTEINTLGNNNGTYINPPSTNLILNYKFDGNLNDISGNNYNITRSSNIKYGPGVVGNSALYLANESALAAGRKADSWASNVSTIQLGTSFTTSCWINVTTTTTTSPRIWELSSNFGTTNYNIGGLYLNSGNPVRIQSGYKSTPGDVNNYYTYVYTPLNTWNHVTTIYTPTGTLIYQNGRFISSNIFPSPSTFGKITANSLIFGDATTQVSPRAFPGYIDDFRIYNRELSPAEINGLYYNSPNNVYALYQQPIETFNVADLQWGTANAQPVTVSAWIKNNCISPQSFTLSLNNALNMSAYLPFNGSIVDVTGQCTVVGASNWTPTYVTGKVGTNAIMFTNPNNAYATQYIDIFPPAISSSPPLSVSFWIQYRGTFPPVSGNVPVIMNIGAAYQNNSVPQIWFSINASVTVPNIGIITINTPNTKTPSTQNLLANTWYHFACTYDGQYYTVYINGSSIGSISVSGNIMGPQMTQYGNYIRFGDGANTSFTGGNYTGWNGYLDDLRIYNSILTPGQISQLYANNVNSTSTSTYLLPRTILYQTPNIAVNSWCNIQFNVPGDTTGYWNTGNWSTNNNTPEMNLALCLGSSGTYSNINANASTWITSNVVYNGNSTQIFGSSSNNLLANTANSIYITGVQLEPYSAGLATPFEIRPPSIESALNAGTGLKYTNGNIGVGNTQPYTPFANSINSINTVPNSFPSYGNINAGNLGALCNRVINGDMSINQRGTVYAPTTLTANAYNGQFLVDRFYLGTSNASGTGTITLIQNTLDSSDLPYKYGFTKSLQINTSAALTQYYYCELHQLIEGVYIADFNWGDYSGIATPATLSFWTRSTVPTGSLISVSIRNFSGNLAGYTTSYTSLGNNTWQYVSYVIPPPPRGTSWPPNTTYTLDLCIGGIQTSLNGTDFVNPGWTTSLNSISSSLYGAYNIYGNGKDIEFTGIQLEKGSIATPFDFRPYAYELQLCQRYFQIIEPISFEVFFYLGALGTNGSNCIIRAPLIVPMRSTPSYESSINTSYLIRFDTPTSFAAYSTAVPVLRSDSSAYDVSFTISGIYTNAGQTMPTSGMPGYIYPVTTTTKFALSDELILSS